MAAMVTYLGGAKDHDVDPQVFPPNDGIEAKHAKTFRDGNGKFLQDKRQAPLKEAEIKFKEIETYDLWGTKFPKGKPVRVERADLAKKAKALGCFEVRDVEIKVETEAGEKGKSKKD